MTSSIVSKQGLGFLLTINQSIYHLIGLRGYLIYDIFIAYRSYEDLSQNINNQFRYFNDHMHTFGCQLIDQLK